MTWMAAGAITLVVLAAGYVMGMLAERWRQDRERFDAEIEQHEKRLEENRAARHARTVPDAGTAMAIAYGQAAAEMLHQAEPDSVPDDRAGQAPAAMTPGPVTPARQYRSSRPWTDAASIGPVGLPPVPEVAAITLRAPQASRWPIEDTGILGKITSTGDIPVIGDAIEARIRADNATWLEKWGAGAAL